MAELPELDQRLEIEQPAVAMAHVPDRVRRWRAVLYTGVDEAHRQIPPVAPVALSAASLVERRRNCCHEPGRPGDGARLVCRR